MRDFPQMAADAIQIQVQKPDQLLEMTDFNFRVVDAVLSRRKKSGLALPNKSPVVGLECLGEPRSAFPEHLPNLAELDPAATRHLESSRDLRSLGLIGRLLFGIR